MTRMMKALVMGAGLLVLMGAGSGCQTPTTPSYSGADAYDAALRSYENCQNRLYPYNQEGACNDIGSSYGQGMSYNRYYGNIYGKSSPEESYGLSNLKAGYGNYLSTLSESQLRDMAEQWDRL